MPLQNNPAPRGAGGEAVAVLLGSEHDTPNTIALRRAILMSRHHVHPLALRAVAEAAWSGGRPRD
jgi:hypothetical protein